MVQHASSVLTRLYLMTTVGSVFIKVSALQAVRILNIELTRKFFDAVEGATCKRYTLRPS